jgi:hypothetical protein
MADNSQREESRLVDCRSAGQSRESLSREYFSEAVNASQTGHQRDLCQGAESGKTDHLPNLIISDCAPGQMCVAGVGGSKDGSVMDPTGNADAGRDNSGDWDQPLQGQNPYGGGAREAAALTGGPRDAAALTGGLRDAAPAGVVDRQGAGRDNSATADLPFEDISGIHIR